MRLAVIGSRIFNNYSLMKEYLDPYKDKISVIVSGGAKGADTLAERWADENGKEKIIILAEWEKYGTKAGFIRNEDIVINCNKCIAFWDGISSGTKSSLAFCEKYKKPYVIITI